MIKTDLTIEPILSRPEGVEGTGIGCVLRGVQGRGGRDTTPVFLQGT